GGLFKDLRAMARSPRAVAWSPDHGTGLDRRSPPLLCSHTTREEETFGRAPCRGQETTPQRVPTNRRPRISAPARLLPNGRARRPGVIHSDVRFPPPGDALRQDAFYLVAQRGRDRDRPAQELAEPGCLEEQ